MTSVTDTPVTLAQVLKDSSYKLTQFSPEEIQTLESSVFLKETARGPMPYVRCLVRNKDIKLTPEETIRQLLLGVLLSRYGYPKERLQLEYVVVFGRQKKRADIVIFDKDRPTVPYIMV